MVLKQTKKSKCIHALGITKKKKKKRKKKRRKKVDKRKEENKNATDLFSL